MSQWEDNHIFKKKNIDECYRDAEKLKKIIRRFPETTFYYKPLLEHIIENPQRLERIFARLNDIFQGDITLINSPVRYNGQTGYAIQAPNVVNEKHHVAPYRGRMGRGYSFSHDGEDMFNIELREARDKEERAAFYQTWIIQNNLTMNWQPYARKARHLRKDTTMYAPLLRMQVHMLRNPKEIGTRAVQGVTWKAQAEQHSEAPQRWSQDNKPVLLSVREQKRLKITDSEGNDMGAFRDSGNLKDGRYGYRLNAFGHTLSRKALRETGSALCFVKSNNGTIAVVDPVYREGTYRRRG